MHQIGIFAQVGKDVRYYNDDMGYTAHALTGFSYATAQKIAVGLISLVKMAILARLIGPESFGVFALVVVVLGVSEATTQTGVNVTIVQSDKPVTYFLNSAWVIATIRGGVIGLLTMVIGYVLSVYYAKPDLLPLIVLAASIPLIKGLINPAIISMQKNLQFDRDSLYRFSLSLVESLAAIGLGLIFHSAWALVGSMVLAAVFEVFISFQLFAIKPKWSYEKESGSIILRNGKSLSLSTLLSYLSENIDDLIVGKTTSTYTLGLYHNAYSLAHKPNLEISKLANHSLMPIYVRVLTDLPRLKKAFFNSLGWITLLIIGLTLSLILWPTPIVELVLGKQWLPIVGVLSYLAVSGIFQAIANTAYVYLIAQSHYKLLNLHLAVSVTVMAGLMYYLTSSYGLWGAGLGLMLARILTLPLLLPVFWLKPQTSI